MTISAYTAIGKIEIKIDMLYVICHNIIKKIQDKIKGIGLRKSSIYNINIIKDSDMNNTNYKIINNQIPLKHLKKRISNLIRENDKYFIAEIGRTTLDVTFYDCHEDLQRLKLLGYTHTIAVEVYEKYGIFLYATDLYEYIHAPIIVSRELEMLINEFGLEQVTEEIALFLRENYPDRFGIYIICTP